MCESYFELKRGTLLDDKIYLSLSGAIAQLGERIVRNDEVVGSIPTSSTKFSITSRRCLTQFCPKLVQKFSGWLPEFASTHTGNRKTSCLALQNPQPPRNKKGDGL